jgi:hypothetical protein
MDQKNEKSSSEKALRTLWLIIFVGLAGVLIYAVQASSLKDFVTFAVIGIMIAGTALLGGGLLGFLFGIPRTLQQEGPAELLNNPAETRAESGDQLVNYRANTNLEQISDWLTKILVGVGLTQINQIPRTLQQLGGGVAPALGNANTSQIFAMSTILFFLICGFLYGYLWTRLFLPGAFRQADLSALVDQVKEARTEAKQANQKVKEFEKQAELDARALSLLQRQLNPGNDIPAVTQEELNAAIRQASRPVKVQIFNQAQSFRSANWQNDKAKMELTIPIFQALIQSDIEGKFHRNHGQLGFALKDQQKPNWAEAEAALTKAIELRGPWEENGWLFYEFNRAICRIKQDETFLAGQASKPEVRDKILSDLRAAAQSDIKQLILNDPEIKKWMSQNSVTRKNLN